MLIISVYRVCIILLVLRKINLQIKIKYRTKEGCGQGFWFTADDIEIRCDHKYCILCIIVLCISDSLIQENTEMFESIKSWRGRQQINAGLNQAV